MKGTQRIVVIGGLALAALAAAFPPWIEQGINNPAGNVDMQPAGLAFVLTAGAGKENPLRPDYGRFACELVAVAVLTAGVYVGVGWKKERTALG
ncbi:MAG TPA: hypothetical protein VG269_26855 [Tepidisphaeraceae bacterium]|nr:hypothetical protein [Tepidisphaeraceae bacterium]